ncbi:putative tyrosyl-dna phosphodiesterase domain-containing protein [Phaeoacremonium minimum UCRPA7]|uniref:Putative tyrosyl-dna phosphodiesterase domain-containing protein n=1 Tax=Phaeoacremonium minimum (strain UCR-PA7) TaxID=1286976 RepID=R8BU22_PHAM7|nr:putative tyrosyl-dna phosphodiesterase domain-containing protein [Phaeoacremonium minimum UCRPA7]EOO02856.1 putative tyrosyl-dna phosphodiesterase domain-containing protein [Phaeoacremonium minimum UCRPA7]
MATNWAAEFNGDEDEDEALKRAIAMSLGEDVAGDTTSSDRDESDHFETQAQESLPNAKYDAKEKSQVSTQMTTPESSQATQNAFSSLGLDRKKMEEERLARLQKRKATEAGITENQLPSQRVKMSSESSTAPTISRNPRAPVTRFPAAAPEKKDLESSSAASSTHSRGLKFPRGVVKKTWALGQPRQDDDIKIEEVLQKDDLELAVLSSYQWDEDWLMSKLNFRKTKVVLIAFAADEATREAMRSNVPANVIRFCFPPMEGADRMHSKLQLLKYPNYLRIVVPTGNFMPYDWGETGAMENMAFIIDLPRIEDEVERVANELTAFGNELCYFLKAQGLEEQMIRSLRNYDFSETARYGGGSHLNDWQRTGYCGLGRTISSLGLATGNQNEIDYVV